MKHVDYRKPYAPPDYVCGNCSAADVKLWRQYQTFQPKLLCASCVAQDQHKNISDMNADGLYTSDLFDRPTDQIGWYVPAIPDENGVGFWGYTSIPPAGYEWWKRLPNTPIPEETPSLVALWRTTPS